MSEIYGNLYKINQLKKNVIILIINILAKLTKVHPTVPSIHCVSFKAEKLITHQQSESSRLQVVASATAKIPQLWT